MTNTAKLGTLALSAAALHPKGTPHFDVLHEDYAADPTGTVDSSSAIKRAIDDAWAVGYGKVLLPPGRYKLTSGIEIPEGVHLSGVGAPASRYTGDGSLLSTGSVNPNAVCLAPTSAVSRVLRACGSSASPSSLYAQDTAATGLSIQYLTIDASALTISGARALSLEGVWYSLFQGLKVIGITSDDIAAFWIGNASSSSGGSYWNTFQRCFYVGNSASPHGIGWMFQGSSTKAVTQQLGINVRSQYAWRGFWLDYCGAGMNFYGASENSAENNVTVTNQRNTGLPRFHGFEASTTPTGWGFSGTLNALQTTAQNTAQNLTAPVSALAGAGAGNLSNGDYLYAVTFTVTGPVSPVEYNRLAQGSATTVVDHTTNGQMALTAIPVGPAGTTARTLYRTIAGGSTYLRLATISDNVTTTYTDNIADASLGVAVTTGLPDFGYDPYVHRERANLHNGAGADLIPRSEFTQPVGAPWFSAKSVPVTVNAGDTIDVSAGGQFYVQSSGGAVNLSTNQFTAGPSDNPSARKFTLIGASNTNYPILVNGGLVSMPISQVAVKRGVSVSFEWQSTLNAYVMTGVNVASFGASLSRYTYAANEAITVDATLMEIAGPGPSAAPTGALAGLGAGNLSNGSYRYAVTFVTAAGETDGIAQASGSATTVADHTTNGQIALTAIPTGKTTYGGQVVTARKIYRTTAGGTTFALVATISDNTTTTYTDNVADGSLGAALPALVPLIPLTLAAGTDGQLVTLRSTSSTSIPVLTTGGTLALQRTGKFYLLSGQTLTLIYTSNVGAWVEVASSFDQSRMSLFAAAASGGVQKWGAVVGNIVQRLESPASATGYLPGVQTLDLTSWDGTAGATSATGGGAVTLDTFALGSNSQTMRLRGGATGDYAIIVDAANCRIQYPTFPLVTDSVLMLWRDAQSAAWEQQGIKTGGHGASYTDHAASYTFTISDWGKTHSFDTSGASRTATLSNTLPQGWWVFVFNSGGVNSLSFAGTGCDITSNSLGWRAAPSALNTGTQGKGWRIESLGSGHFLVTATN